MSLLAKWGIGIAGVIGFVIVFLVIAFIIEVSPNQGKENKVKEQAKTYIAKTYTDEMNVYDTLYDNMGNHPEFEYAAKVRNEKTGITFLVYQDERTSNMEDTYTSELMESKLSDRLEPHIEKMFEQVDKVRVIYEQTSASKEFNSKEDRPNIQESEATPTINVVLNRESKETDEKTLNSLVKIIKNDIGLKHAFVSIEYSDYPAKVLKKEY
ncbi:hypothetical protein MUO14_11835 [Halobacillus shinanisalinarum]|uniref:Uncharacterized protein n=1 Tax=Halobacillus shinanisalinarum TaxID=2932258 RepID=A0ABY4H5B4_9BACI|nr:hypothetical protein [Halobacillus shinanisalinarum]UOQ95544.1 hypothetical protein MUO14_11835 [Halobacillus shinanisalinarum]